MQRQAFILRLFTEDMFRISGKMSINLCQLTLATRFLSGTDVVENAVKELSIENPDDLIWYAVAFLLLGLSLIRKKKEQK